MEEMVEVTFFIDEKTLQLAMHYTGLGVEETIKIALEELVARAESQSKALRSK